MKVIKFFLRELFDDLLLLNKIFYLHCLVFGTISSIKEYVSLLTENVLVIIYKYHTIFGE